MKAAIHEVKRDKVEVVQLADLPGTTDAERPGPVISCISNSGGFMRNAMPEVDSLKLGNEVKAAIHEVRCDKTKSDQSAGLSGRLEIECLRNRGITAGATARKPQEHQAGAERLSRCRRPRARTKVNQSGEPLGNNRSRASGGRASCRKPGTTQKPCSCCSRSSMLAGRSRRLRRRQCWPV